ncbi:MTMR9 [Mytilus coruscus]|uniref:MTMR9 n=1 Tax=Mytilus coruscus TaxID=42192 RepID=A0A6J8E937_MYTCO|nr:MTMR9 [Mytilus coruscus]
MGRDNKGYIIDTRSPSAAKSAQNKGMVKSVKGRDNKGYIIDTRSPSVSKSAQNKGMVKSVMGRDNKGYIIDTRSPSAAKSAQNKGGGYEPEVYYPQWRRIHQSVDRRQAFHDSLIKLMESSLDNTSSMDKWLSKLESSNWLSHVKDILTCACTVAQCIDSEGASVLVHGSEGFDTKQDYLPCARASVLVHGSEGFDTTLQVTSLVQLILDHDCRTINGFEALVEREWLQGGHPFADRCSKSAFAITKQRSESPVFLLFLDCVWQIWQQFPCSFEFNEEFLIWQQFPCSFEFNEAFLVMLFEHTYSSQFGTFLCNNEKERKECKLSSRTVSLWTYLARPEVLQKYLNPMYDPNPRVIWPSVAPQSLVLWSGLYQRSIIDQSKQKEAWQEVSKIREYDKELRSKVTKLRRLATRAGSNVRCYSVYPELQEPEDKCATRAGRALLQIDVDEDSKNC